MDDLFRNSTSPVQSALLDKLFTNTSLGHRLLERLDLKNLRHAFYLISPYETTVDDIDKVPNYNVEVSTWWLVFLVVEFATLAATGHHDRIALNDTITSVCAGMLSQCFKFGGRTVAIFLYVFVWNNFRLLELPWDSPWTWILCLFMQDLMYYFGHRAVHEFGFFWGLHTIHHSSEYYNFSTALRQAAIQDAGLALYDVLQLFDTLGPLGLMFNTPSHHRVHHGRNAYCIDRNYGGVFIIWDRMFGTFEAERKEEPPVYGLIKNEENFNQLWLQFHTLIYLLFFKAFEKNGKGEPRFPQFLDKVRAPFYPPGWYPSVPTFAFFHWRTLKDSTYGVPAIEYPVVKYNPGLEIWMKAYLLGHFTLLLAIFFHFEYDRNTLSYVDFSVKIAFFVVSMQCFGAFFDKIWYAPGLEIARCLGVKAYYSILLLDHIGAGPHRVFTITVFGFSSLIWMAYCLQKAVPLIMKCFAGNRVGDREDNQKKQSDHTEITVNTDFSRPEAVCME